MTKKKKATEKSGKYYHIIAFLVPCLLYAQTIGFKYLIWDDTNHIFENHLFTQNPLAAIPSFFSDGDARVIAMVNTVWALLSALFGLHNVWVFHMTNVMLHGANSLLVFLILDKLVKHKLAAFISALFFAVHPLMVEPVAWISGLKDVLATFFAFGATYCYVILLQKDTKADALVKQRTPYNWHLQLLSILLFVAAILSKPTTGMLPFVLAGLGVAFRKDYSRFRKSIFTLVAMIAISIPIYISTISTQPHSTMDYVAPWYLRPLVVYDALSFYLFKVLAPLTLCPDYARNPEALFSQKVSYAIWALPVAIFALAAYFRKPIGRIISISLLCSFVILLPVSGILPFEFQDFSTVADRYFYFPMFGICLAVALFVKKFELERFRTAIFIVLCIFAGRSVFGIQPWQNNQKFFQNAIACNPTSAGMHMHSGLHNFKTGNYRIALAHYQTALRIKPDYQEAHLNYGQALAVTGNLDSAIVHYKYALRIMPTAEVYNNLGTAYAQQNHLDKAIESFEKALETSPVFVEALCNMGYAMFLMGKNDQARTYLNRALQMRPGYQDALIRLRKIESNAE